MNVKMKKQIIRSFRKVKSDILQLQKELFMISEQNERIVETLAKLTLEHNKQTKIKPKKKKTAYVAAKEGTKFHTTNCPFAQNIKKKVSFKSKVKALEQGYKACRCVK